MITNHHVIDGASDVAVIFADGARFPAIIVGSDPVTDLGVLLVDREDMTPLEIGSSDHLTIGEPAVAVGNPLGLEGGPTVTTGIVSALNRTLRVDGRQELFGLVQTDAPIAPGSSGGALVDAEARLIGITTAIADAVWDEATAGHTTAGSYGKKVGDLPTFPANFSSLAIDANGQSGADAGAGLHGAHCISAAGRAADRNVRHRGSARPEAAVAVDELLDGDPVDALRQRGERGRDNGNGPFTAHRHR